MKYQISTGPTAEPVSLKEAKTQLRVDGDDENTYIINLISTARRNVEQETGRVLMLQTVKAFWDKWPAGRVLCLPLYPAASISLVEYVDENGTTQTWNASNYTTDVVGMTPRVVPNPDTDLPDLGDYPNAIVVTYTAGEQTAATVPQDLKHRILVSLTMLYERREDIKLNDNTPGIRTAAWLQFSHRSNLI
jgi:uncharacterized phiE125 gp8 family phage protein